jgi:hypothetical protein
MLADHVDEYLFPCKKPGVLYELLNIASYLLCVKVVPAHAIHE